MFVYKNGVHYIDSLQDAVESQAVSYTHLDVYKRQPQCCEKLYWCITGIFPKAPDKPAYAHTN